MRAIFALALVCSVSAYGPLISGDTCTDRCITAGHCCTGNHSSDAQPSCNFGCYFAQTTELDCNNTCLAAAKSGCSFPWLGKNWDMCGGCPSRWVDPTTRDITIVGNIPTWPPGWEWQGCSPGPIWNDCQLGCVLAFNPDFNPSVWPPVQPPPAPVPEPPAPWPSSTPCFGFSPVFSDHMVLQQAPAAAAVFGNTGTPTSDGVAVVVTVTPSTGAPYSVNATVTDGRWKALLQPTPDSNSATTYSITAVCGSSLPPNSGVITVLEAMYGSNCATDANLTALAKSYCNGKTECDFQVCNCNNNQCAPGAPSPCIPDPATGCAKDFKVSWQCSSDAPGRVRSAYLAGPADNKIADLNCGPPCTSADNSTINDVVFGDVWFCAGQSNMWYPMGISYARDEAWSTIQSGAVDNIRLMAGDSETQSIYPQIPPTHPWRTIKNASLVPATSSDSWDAFSAACYHTAEEITLQHKAAGKTPPTLGLLNMGIGGSMIEEWMSLDMQQECWGYDPHANTPNGANHLLYDTIITVFKDMTLFGWLYYQGENNAGGFKGSAYYNAGYACLMPKMIAEWRALWSATPGTTSPSAPFGLVSLSATDSEGASDIGAFRWAQSGSYGVVPNELMPSVFMAHAYDLADPWINCNGDTKDCPGCDTVDPKYNCSLTNLGPSIHPRLKKPVGQRLAVGALATAYGWPGPVTGPTITGCTVAGSSLTLGFNATLLAGASMAIAPHINASWSGLSVLINSTAQPMTDSSGVWVALDIALTGPTTVTVDLTPLSGAVPQAVKYAWGPTGGPPDTQDVFCCLPNPNTECLPYSCPLQAVVPKAPGGMLPTNPFYALIQGGKCLCPLPQVCSA